ncbi:TPA: H-NS histone family protein [Pseudomonas putida]|uniref:H-NS histone family protein n=1 Tax=Pseudomonas aeruginosa TaxID=287 RepID=UPI00053ED03E|nr:H-NS histone family protein [Pseudomonas aeruginosa]MBG6979288.1 H-NS histone family protein [Pseudomonas aeruginosa]HBN9494379.1 H-NS histone family protein [Pseudomonas aeruginosa]
MSIELQGLSATELKNLIAHAQDQLVKGERERIRTVREKIQRLLNDEGLSLEQVFSASKRSSLAGNRVAPKYANPDDASLTWSGRGMQPKWFKDALNAGKTPDQLLLPSGKSPSAGGTPQTVSDEMPKKSRGRAS